MARRSGPTQQRVDAVNAYQINNLDRYGLFLENPVINSPYADNDSLETRGATWSFLRYAADHQGTSDGTVWRQLVNSTTTGLANLTNVFGAPILNEFRDWSISVYTDDLVATAAAYQQPSWSFRTVLPLISDIRGRLRSRSRMERRRRRPCRAEARCT